MKVSLISYTQNALELLLNTKNTRMGGKRAEDMTPEEQAAHLKYMLGTIKSSWEFIDFIFDVSEVSRACTQQVERHRHGSFAERTMRALDMSDAEFIMPEHFKGNADLETTAAVSFKTSVGAYTELVQQGAQLQDARSVLPLNTSTGLMVKFNLRSLHEMAKVRLCARTQGETQRLFRAMREAVIAVYPWAADFLQVACVADGRCAFPNYGKKECKHWDDRMDVDALCDELKIRFWSDEEMAEANPVAQNGVSM
ncbi:FAD-dependent thymidylate synthase [Aeromonas phage Gekk3-15]